MENKNRILKPVPVWRGALKRQTVDARCVHCGKPLQPWEYLRNKFYHATCILKIKRSNL